LVSSRFLLERLTTTVIQHMETRIAAVTNQHCQMLRAEDKHT